MMSEAGLMGVVEHFGPRFCLWPWQIDRKLGKLRATSDGDEMAVVAVVRSFVSFGSFVRFVRSFVLLRPWIIGETHSERLFIAPWRRRRLPRGHRWEDRSDERWKVRSRSLSLSLARLAYFAASRVMRELDDATDHSLFFSAVVVVVLLLRFFI